MGPVLGRALAVPGDHKEESPKSLTPGLLKARASVVCQCSGLGRSRRCHPPAQDPIFPPPLLEFTLHPEQKGFGSNRGRFRPGTWRVTVQQQLPMIRSPMAACNLPTPDQSKPTTLRWHQILSVETPEARLQQGGSYAPPGFQLGRYGTPHRPRAVYDMCTGSRHIHSLRCLRVAATAGHLWME